MKKILKQSEAEQKIVLTIVSELIEKIKKSLQNPKISKDEEFFLKSNFHVLEKFKIDYIKNIKQ